MITLKNMISVVIRGVLQLCTVDSPIIVYHNNFLECMLILIMRISVEHINFLSMLKSYSISHINSSSRELMWVII